MTAREHRDGAIGLVRQQVALWTPLQRAAAYKLLNEEHGERMGEIDERIDRLARDEARAT